MLNLIPDYILKIYTKFHQAGFEIYFVGGCVRDMIMNKQVKDWDFATNATPEEILKLFPDGFYDNQFGTVGIPLTLTLSRSGERELLLSPSPSMGEGGGEGENPNNQIIVEVTTFRTEHGYSDKRRPDKVEWGKTIEEDLSRRDFTMNSIALKLTTNNQQLITNIIDPFHGQQDIEQKTIRAVGNPNQRFKEDALRLLRAIRFATELQFSIEEHTWQAIVEDAKLIEHISGERIRIELLRILASDYPYEGIMLLKNSGLLQQILPELVVGIGISQARPGRHHTTDVFTHNVMSLKHCPSKDPIVRFATLLHDIGKPKVEGVDEQGLVIFHNHEIVGAKIAREICDRLKFSKKEREKIVDLIRWHMFTVDEHITDAAVRRFIRRIGVENVKDMIDLRIGDRLGSGTQTAESWRLKKFKERIEDQLKPAPFSINDLAIDGHDIMKELGIKPGPQVGEILQNLFEEVDEDLSKNTKEYLVNRLKEIAKST